MRITRSTLRRIIAEESARILAESKKNPHERVPGGHQMRMAAGFEDEPEEEDWDDEGGDDDYYGDPDPFGDDEALEMGYEYDPSSAGWKKPGLDEGEGKKRHMSPRDRLAAYLERVGADVDAVMAAVDDAVSRGNEEGSEVSSEDITFNLSDEVLDAIPEDDSDRWHSMLDAVIADEVDLDAFADAEADRQDVEDTQRDLSHPSNFIELEEGEDALDEYGDPDDSDPDGGQMDGGRYATDDELDYLRGGGSYSNSPYADLDVPDNRYTRGRAKGFGREPRIRGADIDSGYDDADDMGDNLSEARWAKLAGVLKG